jgi:hypothetical protein
LKNPCQLNGNVTSSYDHTGPGKLKQVSLMTLSLL